MPQTDPAGARNAGKTLFRGILFFLAALVIVRFILELAGVPITVTRFLSSTAGLMLAAIYFAAVGPLKGVALKFSGLVLPAFVFSAWTVAWVLLFTFVAGVFQLGRSHFAEPADFGNLGHLGHHMFNHSISMLVYFVIALLFMVIVHLLWRWPVTVAPGAMLGAFVVIRYWLEAMGLPLVRTAAWSTTVGILVAGFYLGGVGRRFGLASNRQLLVPALVLGWAWRIWVFIAILMSAIIPYRTHFFDPTLGNVPQRLAGGLVNTVVEGFVAGLIVWGIAAWIACATTREGTEQS
jgi:hypothetical protein